jgi:hypothetical protein
MTARPAGDVAEVDRLRAEVARLEQELQATTATSSTKRGGGWWRGPIVALCLVLVGVLAPLSILATWAHDEVSDTDRYVETVAPLAQSPEVQAAVTTRLTDRIMGLLDVEAVTQDAVDALAARGLRPRAVASLTALSGPLTQGVETFVGNQVGRIVGSDEFADAWAQANRVAHTQMVAVLSGETGEAVQVTGGTVQLNLGVVIDRVKERLLDTGFTLASRIPQVSAEITLFQSDELARAQTAFRLLDAAARALPVIALVLLGLAVAVSVRRRRTLTLGALVIAASMLALGAALNLFRIAYLDAVPSDRLPADAAAVIFDQIVEFIRLNLRALLVVSLAVAFVAWVSGPDPAPAAVRRGTTRALDSVRNRRDSAGLGTGPVGDLLYTYRTPLRVLVLGGAVLAYALADHPTGAWTLVVVAVAALILLVLELLSGPPDVTRRGPIGPSASHPA